jgi:hypothetical protein
MLPHPENDPRVNDLINAMNMDEVVPVKCQCGADTVINAAYAKYIKSPISSCSKCR